LYYGRKCYRSLSFEAQRFRLSIARRFERTTARRDGSDASLTYSASASLYRPLRPPPDQSAA
jgi:hypothetical protein